MHTIAFTGGGTGGHIYPGLAVAVALKARLDCRLVWIGADGGMDRSLVEAAGIEFRGVPSGKLRRYFSLKNAADVLRVLAGFFASRRILHELRPSLLFSKGGFVSVPPCAAAASLGIPVFTHESDYSPGLATRLNARWAERILVAYPETVAALPQRAREKAVVTGNPVRADFRKALAEAGRRFLGIGPEERVLLVLGGSQGARQVNELVWAVLPKLLETYIVVHQTGPGLAAEAPSASGYKPYEYLRDELPSILAAAELVVGRSGAGTVWEAATAGKPMVLVPLCGSGTRGDQVENAAYFEKKGAAFSLEGEKAKAVNFAEAIGRISGDPGLRSRMASEAALLGALDSTRLCTDLILDRLGGHP